MPLESKCWFDKDDNAHVEVWCPRPEMGLLVCDEDVMREMTLCTTILNRLEINEKRREQIQKIIDDATAPDGVLERSPSDIAADIFEAMVTSGMVRADVRESDVPF